MLSRVLMAARWAFDCGSWSPTEAEWQLLSSGVDALDKQQVEKFVFLKDVKSAMVGRFLTKKFICEATDLPWRDVKILRDSANKKPYFPTELFPACKVQFNISHSGDFVILAGEKGDMNLGVDLMKVEKQRATSVPEFFRLMSKQFAPEEWDVVKSQRTEGEQMAMFYRFWCLKESYTKATGTGITVDLQKICFKLNNPTLSSTMVIDDTEVFVNNERQIGWVFEESLLGNDHIATVATQQLSTRPLPTSHKQLFKTLSFAELTSRYEQVSEYDSDYCSRIMVKRNWP